MNTQLDLANLAQPTKLEVNIHLSTSLRVSAIEAKRRVSRLVISEIGNLLYGGEPTLSIGERICWHVPILLAFPDTGLVGQVGALDVDVESGAVLTDAEQLKEIADYASFLAERAQNRPT